MELSPVIAHRAGAGFAPENTLAAIQQCAERKILQLEMDVCLLGDHTPVMFHDPTWERCSNGAGLLRRTDWDTAQRFDLGAGFNERFRGEKLAKLGDALSLIAKHRLWLNLELKLHEADQAEALVQQTVRVLSQVNLPTPQLLVSSFNHHALQLFYQAMPEVPMGCLFERLPDDWQQQASSVEAVAIHVNARYLKPHQATEVKQAGYNLLCFTVNEQSQAQGLFDMGVDAVFSDHPERIRQAICN